MSHPISPSNGAAPLQMAWLQQSVRQFLGRVNWDGDPPEIQRLKTTALQNASHPLSLTLTVDQFFSTVNWQGNAIATPTHPAIPVPPRIDTFTLDDFAHLF